MQEQTVLFWHRRDLRLHDNAGLFHALKSGHKVVSVFIFDINILQQLPKNDRRVAFIHQNILQLNEQMAQLGSGLVVRYGDPKTLILELATTHNAQAVYTNRDYEPYATERDEAIKNELWQTGIASETYKDQCLQEYNEVLKDDGKPYTIFTPYKNKHYSKHTNYQFKSYENERYQHNFWQCEPQSIISMADIGFEPSKNEAPKSIIDLNLLKNYHLHRDIPSVEGTSRLGVHLRFGIISIRQLAREARQLNEKFLNELIWRDFYFMILKHFPHAAKSAFKPAYDQIVWRNNEQEFERWCKGQTGYLMVDAGMRELNQTGFMHNRVRMVAASFLIKHLLIDWRWGEAYFASKLLDFDRSANNGGWQWAASSGCDAAPYFRIFNPMEQVKKFDPKLEYIKRWVPEWNQESYPKPIVEHKFARERTLQTYKKALQREE